MIWAGSEKRGAQGMADVTLVLDNGDALLPVEYAVVELGRRLYRSGENDYLLNRQRVRLRDLVDLLDSANLAENAFLFIGQGMVDQALALRPEERRPLFEEVAGVRRHERRRRKAEEQLAEAEANLARVEDILAELRPQARRLGQLAEQQATRLTAGEELAAALIAAAHGRWHEAAGRAAEAEGRRDALRLETERALEALEAAESSVGDIAASMAARAELERERRVVHESARAELTALGLREARAAGEIAAAARDRERIAAERATAEADLADPPPDPRRARPGARPGARGGAGRRGPGAVGGPRGARVAARRVPCARRRARGRAARRGGAAAAETEQARRRHADADATRRRRARRRPPSRPRRRERLEAGPRRCAGGAGARPRTRRRRRSRAARRPAAPRTPPRARAGRSRSGPRGRGRCSRAPAGALSRSSGASPRRRTGGSRARPARLGGTRVDEDLGVEPSLRAAVEAALGELARAYVVERGGAASLGGRARARGDPRAARPRPTGSPGGGSAGELRRLEDALAEVPAAGAWPRPCGATRTAPRGRCSARAVWTPDLVAALELQAVLPLGWLAVTRDGGAVVDALAVRIGRGDSPLERRAEADRLAREVEALQAEADAAEAETADGRRDRRGRRGPRSRRHARPSRRRPPRRRRAEDVERSAGRELEAAAREAAWHAAQAERLAGEAERAGRGRGRLEDRPTPACDPGRGSRGGAGGDRRLGGARRRAAGAPRPRRG